MKKFYRLAFVPFGIEVLMFPLVFTSMMWIPYGLTLVLMFLAGLGSISQKKSIQIIGTIALLTFVVWHGIMGYYDYFQWFSTKVAIVVLIYFILVKYFLVRHKNKKVKI